MSKRKIGRAAALARALSSMAVAVTSVAPLPQALSSLSSLGVAMAADNPTGNAGTTTDASKDATGNAGTSTDASKGPKKPVDPKAPPKEPVAPKKKAGNPCAE